MFRVYVVDLTPERLKEVLYPYLHALCDGAQLASPASRSRRGLKINRCAAKASRPPFAFLVDVGGRFLTRAQGGEGGSGVIEPSLQHPPCG
jgi:hypothetical protein